MSVTTAPDAQLAACASCTAPLQGPYCHRCGEKRLDRRDYALGHYLENAVDTFTHFDVKVVKGLWALLYRPGRMTADVLAGRRVAWPKPLQLFLIANVLYFFVAERVGMLIFSSPLRFHLHNWYGSWAQARLAAHAAAHHTTVAALTPEFNHLSEGLSKSLLFVFIPLLALVLTGLLWRRRHYFLEHVVVATHLLSQFLLSSLLLLLPAVLVFGLLDLGHVSLSYEQRDTLSTGLLALILGAWALPLLRRAYHLPRLPALLLTAGLIGGFLVLLQFVYRLLVFAVTLALL
ncbi:DUF3667 domain-containing protein [Hymenobacter yonginensis]|uniref:DUF3667 domain-containing protein n=1 Tax=Hymenobacter yonginensis TaxID=748197 RepID=A0ABY7PR30_9BACT|nr:DUF3667 domain-containing protein [Hymenobacter yonginensis]WBO85295.1 DUF3667 domain-containing protein [Hymenobacter yonginensis]